ncbi:hypothetical protein [endosymbiont GvMRE of Glomus versiforme]|uniref:hypothetical protein n=1 Tax=endosymbiont GvMRE of Glomus versiforme TaxID=2039283 RepID=UPI000EC0C772|nr:hypothetical protein [endosymbiont GvMRE of Glomus versiforme]RHZ35429.1 hypothetical protein GvMRE_IIg14 [endosymbiont GvMRE of Glomus versiforme]
MAKTKNPVISVPTAQKKTKAHLPTPTKPAKKTKQSPVDYYNCLLTSAQNNWLDPTSGTKKKITACCKDCKLNAPALNNQRTEAIQNWITSYQQLGENFAKLIQPIKK